VEKLNYKLHKTRCRRQPPELKIIFDSGRVTDNSLPEATAIIKNYFLKFGTRCR